LKKSARFPVDLVDPTGAFAYKRAFEPPGWAAVAVRFARSDKPFKGLTRTNNQAPREEMRAVGQTESKMPKLKTKSGAKKRFKITGTGKVVYAQRGKRHGMIKRTKKQIRNLRGTAIMFKTDGDNVKKYFLPNA
jgi:large subunit ribosomal protein L35